MFCVKKCRGTGWGKGFKGVTVGSYRIYVFPSYFRPDFIRFPLVDAILQLTVELENFRLKFQISNFDSKNWPMHPCDSVRLRKGSR